MAFLGLGGAAGATTGASAGSDAAVASSTGAGVGGATIGNAAGIDAAAPAMAGDAAAAAPSVGQGLFSSLLQSANGGQTPTFQGGLTNLMQGNAGAATKMGGSNGPSSQMATMVQQLMAKIQQPQQQRTDWSWLMNLK